MIKCMASVKNQMHVLFCISCNSAFEMKGKGSYMGKAGVGKVTFVYSLKLKILINAF